MFCIKPATDIWQVGIVHQPIAALTSQEALKDAFITWLPNPGPFRFLADPFGIQHNNQFTVFVEALDYRVKRGEIHYYQYDANWRLAGQGIALRAPYHLSYPQIIRDDARIYMLPEAHKSGKLTLYRANQFPDQWEPVATLFEQPIIDASIVRYQDRWWMFYALPGPDGRALRELHIAYADALTGPWLPHSANPVRTALDSARPGGTPFLREGLLFLPVQDNTNGYGSALKLLRIDQLSPDEFSASIVHHLSAAGLNPDYTDGLHTLSEAGEVTLIDIKHIERSPMRHWVNLQRRLKRLMR